MSEVFNGGLLTIDGVGHVSFNAAENPECFKWVRDYFATGELPPEGMVCDGKQTLFI
jgi:hypothetical protein